MKVTSRATALLIASALVLTGFVGGAASMAVLCRDASAAFAQALLASINGAGHRKAQARWADSEFRDAGCYYLVLADQLADRDRIRRLGVWSIDFPIYSRFAAHVFSANPQGERSLIGFYDLLRARAEERDGRPVADAAYREAAGKMCLTDEVQELRDLADRLAATEDSAAIEVECPPPPTVPPK